MIDHVTLHVRDCAASRDFYLRALAPLGYELVTEFSVPQVCGLGADRKPDFWLSQSSIVTTPMHLAFAAPNRAAVDAFYAAALAAGATPNGDPGLRSEYHSNYYGSFVIDPDGHNLEAVCHLPG
jgi:catechol 2,3-dioxygenase-like lactoylglutathione lyase family enzyme